jgi:hypothetical protein
MSPKKKAQTNQQDVFATGQPWLSMKSAIIIMVIVSILLVILVTTQGSYEKPFLERFMWGLVFGGSVWIVFLLSLLINRFLRK